MTRIALTVVGLAAVLAAPLAWAQPVFFEAPRLTPREARSLRAPAVIDEAALSRRLDQLATEIEALARHNPAEPRGGRGGRGRGGDRRRGDDPAQSARAALDALRAELRRATPLVIARGRPGSPDDRPEPPVRAPQPAPSPASAETYAALLGAIDAGAFAADKLRAVRQAAEHHHFTCDQVLGVASQLTFGADRIEAIVILHPRVIDPEQAFRYDSVLNLASERATLEARLRALPR